MLAYDVEITSLSWDCFDSRLLLCGVNSLQDSSAYGFDGLAGADDDADHKGDAGDTDLLSDYELLSAKMPKTLQKGAAVPFRHRRRYDPP